MKNINYFTEILHSIYRSFLSKKSTTGPCALKTHFYCFVHHKYVDNKVNIRINYSSHQFIGYFFKDYSPLQIEEKCLS